MCLSNYSARIRGEGRANVSLHMLGLISTFSLTDSNKFSQREFTEDLGRDKLAFYHKMPDKYVCFVNLCSGSTH